MGLAWRGASQSDAGFKRTGPRSASFRVRRGDERPKKGIGRASEDGYFFVNRTLSSDSEEQGPKVTLRDELRDMTPRLRRYARALTSGNAASNELADDIVHTTLMRALGARHVGGAADLTVRLYATVTQIHREAATVGQQARAANSGQPALIADRGGARTAGQMLGRQTKLSAGLLRLPLEDREALLLVGLEGFDHGEAARILRISRTALIMRLTAARTALDSFLVARPRVASQSAVPYLRLVRS